MKKNSLNLFTGNIAIGSIIITAGAATVQSFIDIQPYFNQLAKSSVWDIFIALPVLILSYVIGLVVVRLAAVGFNYLRRQTVKIMVSRILLVNKFESNMLVGTGLPPLPLLKHALISRCYKVRFKG